MKVESSENDYIENEDEQQVLLREDEDDNNDLNESHEVDNITNSNNSTIINSVNNESSILSNQTEYVNPCTVAIINARSVSAKIESLVDVFVNLKIHIAFISETWLKTDKTLDANVADLEESHGVSIIVKNRKRRGGGVGIAYDKNRVSLKIMPTGSKFEIVCATGRTECSRRPVFALSYYVPPDMKADDYRAMTGEVEDLIGKAKERLRDPIIVLAGDSNRRDTTMLHEDFEDIQEIDCPPSRGSAALLTCASNIGNELKEAFAASEVEDRVGQKTDHKTIVLKFDMPRQDYFVKTRFKFRPFTARGTESFKGLLLNTDWSEIKTGDSSESAKKFAELMESYMNECFPTKERTIKSSDLPWATANFKRKVRQRNRCFRREGRSARWKHLKRESAEILYEEKKAYLEKMTNLKVPNGSSSRFFQAVKSLSHREAPTRWKIQSMFPGEPDQMIAEKVAQFFNKISAEYDPIGPANSEDTACFRIPEKYKIAARLRKMKKPKGLLFADIDPRLNDLFSDIIAEPLHSIYEEIARTGVWPECWKAEQVTVIPKNARPGEMSELRNLSCTPLYSKLLESFVLEELKEHVKLSSAQYGGNKGCGVDHFLIDTWNTILTHLEDGRAAANLVSIDFEKAFNRMDHGFCLAELRRKGATRGSYGMVNAFLYGRTMSVRVGESKSVPRPVPGGSPQGSILGNFLFCVTTDSLSNPDPIPPLEALSPIRQANQAPIGFEVRASTPRARGADDSDETGSEDDDTVAFFRNRRPFTLESSAEESMMMNQAEIDEFLGIPERWTDAEVDIRCYIDDFNNIEKIRTVGSVTHITTNPCRTLVHAPKSQHLIQRVGRMAQERKMKVNCAKTQMLCVTGSHEIINSYMNTDNGKIVGGETLKILGYTFGKKPTAQAHVNCMLPKLRRRLWLLNHLKEAGMQPAQLAKIYFSVIRPVADFAAAVYHPLLSDAQTKAIEKVQMRAFKTIYGQTRSYKAVIDTMGYETLATRRENLVRNFAIKASQNVRFKDTWFPLNHDVNYQMRERKKYKEYMPKTERMTKNPLYHMRKVLNNMNMT